MIRANREFRHHLLFLFLKGSESKRLHFWRSPRVREILNFAQLDQQPFAKTILIFQSMAEKNVMVEFSRASGWIVRREMKIMFVDGLSL